MSETCTVCASRNDMSQLGKARLNVDCKTAVFFANASDGPYSNERLERVKKRRGRMVRDASHACGRVRLARFTLEDHAYGASRLPKTTVLQSSRWLAFEPEDTINNLFLRFEKFCKVKTNNKSLCLDRTYVHWVENSPLDRRIQLISSQIKDEN